MLLGIPTALPDPHVGSLTPLIPMDHSGLPALPGHREVMQVYEGSTVLFSSSNPFGRLGSKQQKKLAFACTH